MQNCYLEAEKNLKNIRTGKIIGWVIVIAVLVGAFCFGGIMSFVIL